LRCLTSDCALRGKIHRPLSLLAESSWL
jgi:hypothetical protein